MVVERIDRPTSPLDPDFLIRKHYPGGQDHDQSTHAGGGGGGSGGDSGSREHKGFPPRDSLRDSRAKVNAPEKWTKSVTPEEKDAIHQYTENGSAYYNTILRGSGDFGDDVRARENVKRINELIERAGEGETRVLYRGVRLLPSGVDFPPGSQSLREKDQFISQFESKIGKTVRLKGFQSTSTDATAAPDFAGHEGNPIFEIKSRRGAPIAALSKHPTEQEVVLGHNWKYRVLSVDRDVKFKSRKGGISRRTVIRLEVL